jgi:ribosomal protein L11 methyltransferase
VRAFVISAPSDSYDAILASLYACGTAGIEERTRDLVAYFDDDTLTAERLCAALGPIDGITVEPTAIPDVDWVARFRENFRAFAVGGFWIMPDWEREQDAPAGQRRLVVDPGRAFGTGTHESTALCLLALETLAARGPLGRVLDVGTGSGILAVAALQLGAQTASGCDNDPESIESARTHARLNGVTLGLALADGGRPFAAGRCDTVLANITAPLLIARAAELAGLARSGGRLVLAGLLGDELPAVQAAYAPFGTARHERRGEWASLVVEIR